MSYSRWSDSRWYTYWDCASGHTLDEQVFTVCGDGSFTYLECLEDFEGAVGQIEGADDELRGYVRLWMEDMEREAKNPGPFSPMLQTHSP